IFIDPILEIFGATPNILPIAREYGVIIVIGSFATFFNMIFNNIIRGEGNAKTPMNSMLIGAIGNIVLDPIFIFALNMGVRGAAYATVIAKLVANVYLLRFILSDKMEVKIKKEYIIPNFRI